MILNFKLVLRMKNEIFATWGALARVGVVMIPIVPFWALLYCVTL
jgi:hypothetical protein